MKTLLTLSLFLCATFVFAQTDKEVASQVEKLRLALIDPTEESLSELSSPSLSYGHSSGKMESQAQFIEALVSGTSDFATVDFQDQTIQVSKDIAIVRHNLAADVLDGGISNSIKIGVILVWQKEKGQWKLIARQAYKLP
ncbi:nuclear transport factor 2 family protein [Algoriphagus sp. Y33]|uniref:nuclear transport factor 2 family protein n=1 Tax=Algoriphagus sp. Y33 TaxID=2772483 RepID=UPI001784068D|nr:nuclear transport factor 2 family protein [Algoriphagus sp. Y33]